MNEDLITIVVPCYNVEKYVKKCIDSLKNQTYKKIEIILVNDGSTDKTLDIITEESKSDTRFKIITRENGGLSAARNTGLEVAKGKYISFIDSDDFVDNLFIEKLYDSIKENDSDIAVCDYQFIDENGIVWNNKKNKSDVVYSSDNALIDILSGRLNLEVMTWNKLYKTSLFKDNSIIFPNSKLHEDNYTTFKLFYFSKKISLIKDKLYYYLQRNSSIMGKRFGEKNKIDMLGSVEEVFDFFDKNKLTISNNYLNSFKCIVYLNVLNLMILSDCDEKEIKIMYNKISSIGITRIMLLPIYYKLKIKMLILLINYSTYKKMFLK